MSLKPDNTLPGGRVGEEGEKFVGELGPEGNEEEDEGHSGTRV